MKTIPKFIKSIYSSVRSFASKNPKEFWILFTILTVGAICRLYNIAGYMTFLGDEGRDVIIVRRLLTEAHPPLIGPGTSIGNMYLGPLYYYFMAIPLLVAGFSPIGPAVQIALLGIVTIWFVWYVGRLWFNKTAGLVAAGLYAISPIIIIYSRSSWNPNIMPFFALLSVYAIWKVWKDQKFNWLFVLGFSFASVLQSHYLGLLLAPTLGIYWLLTYLKVRKTALAREFTKKSVYGFLIFVGLMSPLFFFDVRHDWMNARAMYAFFTVRQTTVSIRPWTAIPKIPEMLQTINVSLLGGKNVLAGQIVSIIFGVGFLALLVIVFRNRKKGFSKINPAYFLLVSWFGFGLIGFGIYKQNIYDHYFGFLFAVPFLILGIIISFLLNKGIIGKAVGLLILGYLIFMNLAQNPLKSTPNNQLKRASDVAKKIETESNGQKFNLGVIAERNYEDGYKYFLLKDNTPVVSIDSQDKNSITNQLFAVCELSHEKCDPTHSATAAIANFGWSKVESQWEVDGVIVYKLIHTR